MALQDNVTHELKYDELSHVDNIFTNVIFWLVLKYHMVFLNKGGKIAVC